MKVIKEKNLINLNILMVIKNHEGNEGHEGHEFTPTILQYAILFDKLSV